MRFLIAKINLTAILKAHLDTLIDGSTKESKKSYVDVVVFYAIPAVLSVVGASFLIPSDKSILGILITSLSIFAGLLFNLLVLVMQIIEKKKGDFVFKNVQKATYANISYAILISLVTSAVLLIPYFVEPERDPNLYNNLINNAVSIIPIEARIFWGIVYFLLINFALTMAMILKRMHGILVKIMDY